MEGIVVTHRLRLILIFNGTYRPSHLVVKSGSSIDQVF